MCGAALHTASVCDSDHDERIRGANACAHAPWYPVLPKLPWFATALMPRMHVPSAVRVRTSRTSVP